MPAPKTPTSLESLIQASSILHACQDASDNGEGGYDLAPALTVAAGLIEAEAVLGDDESRCYRESGQFPTIEQGL